MKTTQRSGGGLFGAMFRRPTERRRADLGTNAGQKVWILQDGQPAAVAVKIGASDGKVTELRQGDIKSGQQVIIDAVSMKQ